MLSQKSSGEVAVIWNQGPARTVSKLLGLIRLYMGFASGMVE